MLHGKHIVSLSVCIWEHQDLLSDANKFPWIVYLHISWTVCFSQNQKDFHWAITILIPHHISKACAVVKHPWNFKTRHAWDFQMQQGETASLQLPKPLFIVPPNQGPCVLGGQCLEMLQKNSKQLLAVWKMFESLKYKHTFTHILSCPLKQVILLQLRTVHFPRRSKKAHLIHLFRIVYQNNISDATMW